MRIGVKWSVLFISFMILLFGCSRTSTSYPTDDAYHFGTDSQYTLCNQGSNRQIAETEEGYYFALTLNRSDPELGGDYLFFTDKETMETVPLCGKPNCMHYAETDPDKISLCNANFRGSDMFPAVYYNEGRLLVLRHGGIHETYIDEIASDGSSRKELLKLEGDGYFPDRFLFHRGYLYVGNSTYTEEMGSTLVLKRYSLENMQREPVDVFSMKGGSGYQITDLSAYGSHVYFSVIEAGTDRDFYHLDTATGKVSEIFNLEQGEEASYSLIPFKGGLLYEKTCPQVDPTEVEMDDLPSMRYTGDLTGGNVQKWEDAMYCKYAADDRYLYEWGLARLSDHYLRVKDLDGNLLVSCDLREALSGEEYYGLQVTQGEHVFITTMDNDKMYYFSKSDIEKGELQIKLSVDCSAYQRSYK